MSNLKSVFDIFRGWPDASALEANFDPEPNKTFSEGTIVYVSTRELLPAKVLRIVDDSLTTAPSLQTSDRGKAYVCKGIGGAWSGFHIGSIVEWDGTAWNEIVVGVGAEVVDGTRVVVIEAGAAGSFANQEEKVLQYSKKIVTLVLKSEGYTACVPSDIGKAVVATGGSEDHGTLVSYDNGTRTWVVDPDTPDDVFASNDEVHVVDGTGAGTVNTTTPSGATWAATVPVSGNRIKINGANSIYENKYYDYTGTHPDGAWYKAARQMEAPAIVKTLTSGVVASVPAAKDQAWIVIQGNDQYDSRFVNRVTCIKCASGAILKIATTIANTLLPGDFVCAEAGALKKVASGAGMQWPIGQVLLSNGTAGADGWVVIATY